MVIKKQTLCRHVRVARACSLVLRKRTTKQAIVQRTEEGEDKKKKTVQQPSKRKSRSLSKEAQRESCYFLSHQLYVPEA